MSFDRRAVTLSFQRSLLNCLQTLIQSCRDILAMELPEIAETPTALAEKSAEDPGESDAKAGSKSKVKFDIPEAKAEASTAVASAALAVKKRRAQGILDVLGVS